MSTPTPPPDPFETKDTRGTLLGYILPERPHVSRTGTELSDAEFARSNKAIGTPHAGPAGGTVGAWVPGEESDSPNARRVGDGRYVAEGPTPAPRSTNGITYQNGFDPNAS